MASCETDGQLASYLPADYGEITRQGPHGSARIGIVMPIFGRPSYLHRCLTSLAESRIQNVVICLVDESSSDLSPKAYPGFEALPGLDSPRGDLGALSGTSLDGIAANALADVDCVAFNSSGWKKRRLLWPEYCPGSTLYVKEGRVPKLWREISKRLRPRPDPQASLLARDWAPPNLPLVKIFKRKHGSMFDSLARGWQLLSDVYDCELLMSLDSDTLVKPDWLERVVGLYDRYESTLSPLVVSGFHAECHRTLVAQKDWRKKNSLGGVNLLFDRTVYNEMVKPCLVNLQWDMEFSRRMKDAGGFMLTCRPSVVQHIGRFGTWSGFLRYDRATDF